jgi:hypothetical protein
MDWDVVVLVGDLLGVLEGGDVTVDVKLLIKNWLKLCKRKDRY